VVADIDDIAVGKVDGIKVNVVDKESLSFNSAGLDFSSVVVKFAGIFVIWSAKSDNTYKKHKIYKV
jgi:hypothetical protein